MPAGGSKRVQRNNEADVGSTSNNSSHNNTAKNNSYDMLSVDEMINDDEDFEVDECGNDDRDWGGEPPQSLSSFREIVDLTSPDAKNSLPLTNSSHICPLQIANSSQAGAQNEVVDITRSDDNMDECDDLQCRRGVKRRLHTVCE